MVRYDEYLEFIRGSVTETAANTYTETTINTPVGRSSNLAMCIHGVITEWSGTLTHGAENDGLHIQLCSVTQTAIQTLTNPNMLFKRGWIVFRGAAGEVHYDRIRTDWFPIPILYAKSQLFFGICGNNQGAAHNAQIAIAYTIRKIGLYKMVEALTD